VSTALDLYKILFTKVEQLLYFYYTSYYIYLIGWGRGAPHDPLDAALDGVQGGVRD
jgi:hypothetical protein